MAAFKTIAAGVGLAATAGSTVMSFAQASAEKKKARAAEQKSEEEHGETPQSSRLKNLFARKKNLQRRKHNKNRAPNKNVGLVLGILNSTENNFQCKDTWEENTPPQLALWRIMQRKLVL